MFNKSLFLVLLIVIGFVGVNAQPVSSVKYETMIEVAEESADKQDYANAIDWFEKAYKISKDKDLKIVIGDLQMLLRDYNNDGVKDIFCYSDIIGIDGVIVYTGKYEQGKLTFTRKNHGPPFNLLSYKPGTGGTLQIYVSKIDYPAIEDVDCDGDLDILTFNLEIHPQPSV